LGARTVSEPSDNRSVKNVKSSSEKGEISVEEWVLGSRAAISRRETACGELFLDEDLE
jgi:hypothetical protein